MDWDAWESAAARLGRALAGAPGLDRRIHHLYLPVLIFAAGQVRARGASARPVFVGVQGPQGAGKTTLVSHLIDLLPVFGLRGVSVSIDDFYLTRAEQVALAAAHPGHPYLEHRGYPGTHDVPLGAQVLDDLARLGPGAEPAGASLAVPAYDKSAHGGRGDRAPRADWPVVTAPLDVVFLEGWMLGFEPVPATTLEDDRLAEPNRRLAAYDAWHARLDAFVVLRALDPAFVLEWRVEAEERMRASGRSGLDRAAILDYVRRFLPAYRTWAGRPPARLADRALTIGIDRDRQAAPAPAVDDTGQAP